jgi:hypothetical protein
MYLSLSSIFLMWNLNVTATLNTILRPVWNPISLPFFFFSLLLKNINFKTFLIFFFIFYITSTLFLLLFEWKTQYNTNFSHINYFNFILHPSYFSITKKKSQKRGKRNGDFKRAYPFIA